MAVSPAPAVSDELEMAEANPAHQPVQNSTSEGQGNRKIKAINNSGGHFGNQPRIH